MKRVFAFVLALALVFSLSITAFATEQTQTPAQGTITITNATAEQTYSIYKIFDATRGVDKNGKESVSYTIKADNQFFTAMFGTKDAEGNIINPYFNYEPSTGAVTKKASAQNADIITYLNGLITSTSKTAADSVTPVVQNGSVQPVVFEGLPFGYYLVKSTLGSTVTIDSNTPYVEIIDKNQKPGSGFTKKIQKETETGVVWDTENSACIGDTVTYQVTFQATNYDGEKMIHHYQIHDFYGDGLNINFDSVSLKVSHTEKIAGQEDLQIVDNLTMGYYLPMPEMIAKGAAERFLGTWAEPEAGQQKDPDDAQWYLVHVKEGEFRITIPWQKNHELARIYDATDTTKLISYDLTYPTTDVEFEGPSPVNVELQYTATIKDNATIGGTVEGSTNLKNTAYLAWVSTNETGTSTSAAVVTDVYGIGILKDDLSTGENLEGAQFEVYKDSTLKEKVNLVPNGVQGVYVHQEASRTEGTSNNVTITPVNGKIVILGLKAGTYYLKEIKAPDGYNSLDKPVALISNGDVKPFPVYAKEDGTVGDVQAVDGTYTKEHVYRITSTTIHNSKGVELPSTGGEGTMLMITIGTMVAMAFGVLLITHKKMSIYKDF